VTQVAKVKRIVRNFGSSTGVVSQSAITSMTAHAGPFNANDTLTRVIFGVQLNTVEDPTSNPPPIGWWGNSRVVAAMSWDPAGGTTLPSSENDNKLKFRSLLYGAPWYSQPTVNDLYGVHFAPRTDYLQLRSRHKGNGTQTPRLTVGLYLHDSNLALTNPGGIYGIVSGWSFYLTTVWECDG
jgi:hypothetical protein